MVLLRAPPQEVCPIGQRHVPRLTAPRPSRRRDPHPTVGGAGLRVDARPAARRLPWRAHTQRRRTSAPSRRARPHIPQLGVAGGRVDAGYPAEHLPLQFAADRLAGRAARRTVALASQLALSLAVLRRRPALAPSAPRGARSARSRRFRSRGAGRAASAASCSGSVAGSTQAPEPSDPRRRPHADAHASAAHRPRHARVAAASQWVGFVARATSQPFA